LAGRQGKSRRRFLDGECQKWRKKKKPQILKGALAIHFSNAKRLARMGELARMLYALQRSAHRRPDLYPGRTLGDVVNGLIRNWPGLSFGGDLCSKAAVGKPVAKLVGEHDLPISFFRDMISRTSLSVNDWHYLIARYMRVRWITKAENRRLCRRHKQNRPKDAYRKAGIRMATSARRLEYAFNRIVASAFDLGA